MHKLPVLRNVAVKMPDRTYHFSAEKEEDRNAWITAVMEAVANIAVVGPRVIACKEAFT